MSVHSLIRRCIERIAPLRLAESWDKVGLIIEAPHQRPNANHVLLTIDLTTAVVDEAIASPTGFVVAYHPPIFSPLQSLTLANPIQASLLRCAAAGISVYCPHTSFDAVKGGINDWLAECLAGKPLQDAAVRYINNPDPEGQGGTGRVIKLPEPIVMSDLERRVKRALNLEHIQVAYSTAKDLETVQSIAICAGSGGTLLLGIDADVYFTGEMVHHEVLEAIATGHNVILCGHTNTERGYLPVFAKKLSDELLRLVSDQPEHAPALRSLEVTVSKADRHPLQIV